MYRCYQCNQKQNGWGYHTVSVHECDDCQRIVCSDCVADVDYGGGDEGNQLTCWVCAECLKAREGSMTTPAYKHPELKSLSEVQSERDNAPECQNCTELLDEDDWKRGRCKDCQAEIDRELRKVLLREYGGGEDDPYYGTGRGMPKG